MYIVIQNILTEVETYGFHPGLLVLYIIYE